MTRFNLARIRQLIVPASLVLLALVLRLVTLGNRPFDGDEAIIVIAAMSGNVIQTAAHDVHPPLYHLLVAGSVSLFGLSTWSVRLVGALAGAALVGLAAQIGRRLGASSWLVGLALACSPFLINLSQDARMYSLFIFLATGSFLAWLAVLEAPKRWSPRMWFVLATVGMVYTHHLGWLVLLVEVLVALLFFRSIIQATFKIVAALLVSIVILYLPQLATTVVQVRGRLGEQAVSPGFGATLKGVVGLLYRSFAGRIYLDLSPGSIVHSFQAAPLAGLGLGLTFLITGLALWLGVRFLIRQRTKPTHSMLLLLAISLGVALVIGSIGTQATRYLAFLVPWLLAAGWAGIDRLPKLARLVGLVAVISLSVIGLQVQYGRHNHSAGIPSYANYLDAHANPTDAILIRGSFGGGELWTLRYYLKTQHQIVDMLGDYSVGNLAGLRQVTPTRAATSLLKQSTLVWFYDQTYAVEPFADADASLKIEIVDLDERDKEGQPLRLYRVSEVQP
jgi:uncharacterized membrane protein